MIDLTTACANTADLLSKVGDEQLAAATPCPEMDLATMIAHIGGLSSAFAAAARKQFGELTDTPPSTDVELDEDWRSSYADRLADLATAWREPAAWEGMSRAGGVEFPAEVGGLIALTEVVVHGWDVAAAVGLAYDVPVDILEAIREHVAAFAGGEPIEGLFGAAVPVADDARLLDRVVALTGRDPRWVG
jgi:uncharacterized protein (TIGR03086 family)